MKICVVLSHGVPPTGRRSQRFAKTQLCGLNFSVLGHICLKLHMCVNSPALNMWYEFRWWAWPNGLATPFKYQPLRHVSLTCMKICTHMYHIQTHKKVSWTRWPNPTGSRPFWISWSIWAISMLCILTSSSYRNHQIDFKIFKDLAHVEVRGHGIASNFDVLHWNTTLL